MINFKMFKVLMVVGMVTVLSSCAVVHDHGGNDGYRYNSTHSHRGEHRHAR